MTPTDLLTDAFERVHESLEAVLDGLTDEQLRHRPGPDANPIGWLVWHLVRVQDDHVAKVAGQEQVYADFARRFDLPYDDAEIGYGHSSDEVAVLMPSSTSRASSSWVSGRLPNWKCSR